MKLEKETVIKFINSPVGMMVVVIAVLLAALFLMNRRFNNLQDQILDGQLKNNQKVIEKYEEKVNKQRDTVSAYTKEIERNNETIIIQNKELDNVDDADSLVALYYKSRPAED